MAFPTLDQLPDLLRPAVERAATDIQAALDALDEDARVQWPRVFAASAFVREWCVRHPEDIAAMLADRRPEIDPQAEQADFERALRRYRNQVMVRIAWQEIADLVTPQDTVGALSDLADECLQQAVSWHEKAMQRRHGQPRLRDGSSAHFAVIALGKLGGRELNYSSDVDVIFAYTGLGESDGEKPLANEQYFVRLGQRVVSCLNDRSEHGFVFRVDLRLRPFGEQSPVAHSLASLEEYYEAHGREWERYAWVKARAVAGHRDTAEQLIKTLQPFVYRRYLDFGSIAAMRDMKAQIDEQVRKRGHEQDIKLGWGGIREVEFVVQVFQLVRGGAEPGLRSNSLMQAMAAVKKLGLHPAEDVDALREAYWFLRRVENCWQAQRDQQSHVLPDNEEPRLALACALGYDSWQALDARLQRDRAVVHAQFAALFAHHNDDESVGESWRAWWRGDFDTAPAEFGVRQLGEMRDKAERWFKRDEDRDAFGELLGLIVPHLEEAETTERVLAILEALIGRANYVTLLVDNAVARRELIQLCQRSPWLAQEMRLYPAVLAELLDPIRLYAPDERAVLRQRLRDNLDSLPADDIEARMDVIRRTRHATMLRIAAADVAAALPIMRVSDRLSELAEEILDAAMGEAVAQMRQRYPDLGEPNFAVIAYGKLGGLELSYTSDLDVVFVYDGGSDDLPLDPQVFYTRLAQKLIHFLATPTGAGTAYEIDTRLRPSGQSGLLVTSIQGLASYQREKAWTWEHQALIRARAVVGSEALRQQFEDLRREVLATRRERLKLLGDVRDMREKMRESLAPRDGSFHPKQSPGGMVDIEFLSQFAVLAHASSLPQVRWYTDVIRILEQLAQLELIDTADAEHLAEAYRQLRSITHQQFLTGQTQTTLLQAFEPEKTVALVERLQARLS